MTEKTSEWFLTQGVLGVMCVILMAAVVWLTLKLLAVLKDRDALHEAHKQELRDNGKSTQVMTEKLFQALERVSDLAARRQQ